MISNFPISLFKIVNAVVPNLKNLFWIPASAADATAVSPNGRSALLAKGVSTFLANGKSLFNHVPRSLPWNPPDYTNLDVCILDNFILITKLFPKPVRIFATCLLVSNAPCGKLVTPLMLSIIFVDSLKVTQVAFFTADFSFSSYECDSFIFTLLYCIILYWYYVKINQILWNSS